MTPTNAIMTLTEFEALLETFGSAPSRWPDERRASAEGLLSSSPDARLLASEARALDRVLAFAPEPDPVRIASLTDRILAAANAKTEPAKPVSSGEGARIIPMPQRKPAAATRPPMPALPAAAFVDTPRDTSLRATRRNRWQAAAALAASLVLGVAIGTTDYASSTAVSFIETAVAPVSETETILASLHADALYPALAEDQR